MNFVDLHCHTTASDGRYSPRALVGLAASLGLRAIGITDHDSTEGLDEALAAGVELKVEIVPGVELSCDVEAGELHMLGYYPDYKDPRLQSELTRLRAGRVGRARAMVQKLTAMGYPISFERVRALAGDGAIGRPHIAQALVEAGHVASKAEAFDRLIGRSGPAYVERARLSPVEAVRLIRQVGGLPVFAHPFVVKEDGSIIELLPIEEALPELIDAGLVGLEVYYPNYTQALTDRLLALARRHNLLVTGGSDFHGAGVAGGSLGSVYVPNRCLTRLKEAHQRLSAIHRALDRPFASH